MGFLCIAQLTLVRATGGCLNYTKWVPFFLIAVKLFAIDTSNTKVSTDINMVAMQKKKHSNVLNGFNGHCIGFHGNCNGLWGSLGVVVNVGFYW